MVSKSTSSSSTISAFFKIFSISSIRASMSRCSSFAASYSAFSDKSPCSRASLIFCATSLRFTTIKLSNSSSNFLRPSLVKMFFFTVFLLTPFCNHVVLYTHWVYATHSIIANGTSYVKKISTTVLLTHCMFVPHLS